MPSESIAVDTGPAEGGTAPFGVSWTVFLGGVLVVVVGVLWLRSRNSSGTAGNPLATSVMLADIQGAQDTLRGEVQLQGAATREAVAGEGAATRDAIGTQLASVSREQATQYGMLQQAIGAWGSEISQQVGLSWQDQATQYGVLQQAIGAWGAQLAEGQGNTYAGLYSQAVANLQHLLESVNGLHPSPAGNPTPFTLTGWQANFGATGANVYDVNKDNIVDVRDYGILSSILGQQFMQGAAAAVGSAPTTGQAA